MYTFSEDNLSDLYKDAYGVRPRGAFWNEWSIATDDGKQRIWNRLCIEVNSASVAQEEEIQKYIEYGAGDRETALRWITDHETFHRTSRKHFHNPLTSK